MSLLHRLASLWRNLVHRERVERALDDELAGYVDLLTAEKVRHGMERSAARRAALLEVGGVQHVKQRVREVRTGVRLEAIAHDVRYAWRGLLRTPGFTAIAIVTLAFGIGANTSIFSIIDAVLVRPLPFREPERLVRVYERMLPRGDRDEVSGHEYVAWRDRNHTLDGLAIYSWSNFNLTGDGEPQSVVAMEVSANFFTVQGVTPLLGRGFVPGEDRNGARRVAVLTSSLWKSRYGSDSTIVGRPILLDGNAVTVVGVMPPLEGFDPELWLPMNVENEAIRIGKHSNAVAGRLKQGVTIAAAEADLAAISADLARELPDANTGHSASVTSQYLDTVDGVRRPLFVGLAAVACVLLIACANVAHLLLQRAAGRQREVAVRIALGASRGRVIQQMLTESIMLSLTGAAMGVALAFWVVHLLPSLEAVRIPRLSTIAIDGRVLAATLGLSLATGVMSGVLPALRATRPALRQWMGEGARSGSVSGRLGGAFVVSEVALAVILLIGAALLIQSFARLVRVDPGFDPRGVLAVDLSLPPSRYSTPASIVESYDLIRARLAAIPGVRSVAATSTVPLSGCCNNMPVTVEGRPPAPRGQSETAVLNIVTPGYFSTMGIRLQRGRDFSNADARFALPLVRYWDQQPFPARYNEPQPAPVALISETMTRKYWPDVDPIGKRFRVLFSPWVTVVGVVADVKHLTLGGPAPADLYLSNAQEPFGALLLVMRTDGDPLTYAQLARSQVRAFDKDLPVNAIASMEQVVHRSVGRPRFNALLIGIFGSIALLLSLVGTYGVISYGVAQRTHEIGVRTALGAQAADVVHLILGRALRLTGIGLLIGLGGALAVTRVLEGMLFDVTPTDATTFGIVALLLAVASLVAGYVPTRRALRIDPAIALRDA